MSKNEYYITEVTITIASDGRMIGQDGNQLSLEELVYEITHGAASARYEYADERRVSEEEIADELTEQGSDPSFLLGDDWDSEPTEETLSAHERNEGIPHY